MDGIGDDVDCPSWSGRTRVLARPATDADVVVQFGEQQCFLMRHHFDRFRRAMLRASTAVLLLRDDNTIILHLSIRQND